jgi:hypothetical protein
MKQLFPIEIRVKTLVDAFFANKITGAEFKRELARKEVRLRLRGDTHREAGGKNRPRGIRREKPQPAGAVTARCHPLCQQDQL